MNIDLKLHHIAYAVKSTDNSINFFKIFYPQIVVYKNYIPSQNVYYTYLSNEHEGYMIELIEPKDESSSIAKLIKTSDCSLYHICYFVEDFDKAISFFKENKFFALNKPFRPVANEDVIICHYFRPETGIIEILGNKEKF